jgi:anti-sigma factor RsiW
VSAAARGEDLAARLEAYLLGRLSDEDQARIEALLFEDDDVLDALRDAEDALIDRYLTGELARADREAFEHTFATSATRQQRIAFARLLSQGVAPATSVQEAPPAAADAPVAGRRARPRARRAVLAAGAALAVALVAAIAWRVRSNDVPGSGDPGSQPPDMPVATLRLDVTEVRRGPGSVPRLRVPPGTTAVYLEPELEATPPAAGEIATVRRVGGAVVWQETLRRQTGTGPGRVVVPAHLLAAGDYVLRLAAPGAPPEAGTEYLFRIVVQD